MKKEETKPWIAIAIIMAAIFFISVKCDGQGWKEARQTKWKKTAISVGSSLLSIGLEMSGDALYDMGKSSGNKSQMQWGHTLQATGYVVPLISIPFLLKGSDNKVISDVAVLVGTYASLRFATADAFYNVVHPDLELFDLGTVSKYDEIMSNIPPHGRTFMKCLSLTLGVSINLNYW